MQKYHICNEIINLLMVPQC